MPLKDAGPHLKRRYQYSFDAFMHRSVATSTAICLRAFVLALSIAGFTSEQLAAQPSLIERSLGVVSNDPLWNRQTTTAEDMTARIEESPAATGVTFHFGTANVIADASMKGTVLFDYGTLDLNRVEQDELNQLATERRYHRDSVVHGAIIAECMVRTTRDVSAYENTTSFVILTGHLDEMELPHTHSDSTVLWIDVSHELGSNGRELYEIVDTAVPCTSIAVRYRDLARRNLAESWEQFQRVAFTIVSCNVSERGGVHLRVRYAGNATLAIHSIAMSFDAMVQR